MQNYGSGYTKRCACGKPIADRYKQCYLCWLDSLNLPEGGVWVSTDDLKGWKRIR